MSIKTISAITDTPEKSPETEIVMDHLDVSPKIKAGKKESRFPKIPTPLRVSIEQISSSSLSSWNESQRKQSHAEPVLVTNLESFPGYLIKRYVGCVSHHFIREIKENKDSTQLPGKNRLAYLTCVFLREAITIARAHVISMGGDGLIGFTVDHFSLITRSGYCLISFSGDAVQVQKRKS